MDACPHRADRVTSIVQAKAWARSQGLPPPRHFIIGVDADTVRVSLNKGYSRSGDLQEMIYALTEWVMAVRVPGLVNAADAVSRQRPLDPVCVQETWRCLRWYRGSLEP